ncbi:MAG: hypothetical protein FWE31_03490 [Firmicutes bacterium]|nr:hypothetical protein [Bacillota bacterium]
MQKSMRYLIYVLGVALTLVFAGAILQGVTLTNLNFNTNYLADAMATIGLVGAILSGIALTGLTIIKTIQNRDS